MKDDSERARALIAKLKGAPVSPVEQRACDVSTSPRVSATDPDLGMKRCKTCNAPVLWAVTEAGRAEPLNFAPSASGTIVIEQGRDDRGRRVWRSHVARTDERSGVRRTSHFATCPDATKHRKK